MRGSTEARLAHEPWNAARSFPHSLAAGPTGWSARAACSPIVASDPWRRTTRRPVGGTRVDRYAGLGCLSLLVSGVARSGAGRAWGCPPIRFSSLRSAVTRLGRLTPSERARQQAAAAPHHRHHQQAARRTGPTTGSVRRTSSDSTRSRQHHLRPSTRAAASTSTRPPPRGFDLCIDAHCSARRRSAGASASVRDA